MINLLPPEEKHQLRAARANTLLIRYNFLLFGALLFLGVVVAVTYFYLANTKEAAENAVNENNAKASNYRSVEEDAQVFRGNLTIAKQILANDVAYTKIVTEIANQLPNGTVLDNLTLDSATFGTETILAARAKSYESAVALKDALQKSSLFTNVHFQSITSEGTGGYPFVVNLYVTIKKEAAK